MRNLKITSAAVLAAVVGFAVAVLMTPHALATDTNSFSETACGDTKCNDNQKCCITCSNGKNYYMCVKKDDLCTNDPCGG